MTSFIKHVINSLKKRPIGLDGTANKVSPQNRKVLNVGGGSKAISIPAQYNGWEHFLLDIDPKAKPDVVCDARKLTDLPGAEFDSVYCSHNLEHYYRHDVPKVLTGFLHILKEDGFAYIRVPDMGSLMEFVTEHGMDITDVYYQSPAGPITFLDVIYGYGKEIESSGNDYYAHKTGFTQKSLKAALLNAGFGNVFINVEELELTAIAFKNLPVTHITTLLNLGVNTQAAHKTG